MSLLLPLQSAWLNEIEGFFRCVSENKDNFSRKIREDLTIHHGFVNFFLTKIVHNSQKISLNSEKNLQFSLRVHMGEGIKICAVYFLVWTHPNLNFCLCWNFDKTKYPNLHWADFNLFNFFWHFGMRFFFVKNKNTTYFCRNLPKKCQISFT